MSTLFSCTPARKNLNHTVENEVYAVVSFNPPAVDAEARAALDLAVALDVSGSMGGGKLEAAKKSLLKLVEHLTDRDHLSVTTFCTHVEVVFPRIAMTAANKRVAVERISALRPLSSTNLSGGILQALALLRDAQGVDGSVRRCMAFTDGQPNEGIRRPDDIVAAVLEYRGGIGVSTFGYGRDHNADLLGKLAQDGAFYYIDNPDRILTAFGTELGGLVSTYAQNVEVRLSPVAGVEIVEVLNDLTVTTEDILIGTDEGGAEMKLKGAVIRCDDLLAEQPYHVVVKLKVGARDKVFPRDVTLLNASASFFDVTTKKVESVESTLKVRFVKADKADEKDDPKVAEEVAAQMIVKATNEAEKHAAAGDFVRARAAYDTSSAYAGKIETARGGALHAMGLGFTEALGDFDNYTKGGLHLATSNKKALSRQRAGSAGSQIGGVVVDELLGSQTQMNFAREFDAKAVDVSQMAKAVEALKSKPVPDPAASFVKSRSRS